MSGRIGGVGDRGVVVLVFRWLARLFRQHPVRMVFAVALVVRLAGVFIAGLLGSDFLGRDDDLYFQLAVDIAEGRDDTWGPGAEGLVSLTWVHVQFLALVVEVFGPVRAAANAAVAVIGACVAAGTAYLANVLTGHARGGVAAGTIVALLPSQIAWSTTTMKDPLVWLASLAAVSSFLLLGIRRGRWGLAVAGALVALLALGYTRDHSVVVLTWSLAAASILLVKRHGWRPFTWAVALLIAAPTFVGLGPAGFGLISTYSHPAALRADMAVGAGSAVVDTNGTANDAEATSDGSDRRGQVSPGWLGELRHLPRGYSIVLLEPYPWHPRNDLRFIFAKIDTVLWYPILAFAAVGAMQAVRRRSSAVVLVSLTGATATLLALFEGNLGTAFRHRGELVWACVILAVLGADTVRAAWGPVVDD